jgi:hypothetical protein
MDMKVSNLIAAAPLLLAGACTSATSTFYAEPHPMVMQQGSASRSASGKIKLHRIAVVPNRLPLNLSDPEKWRRHNYDVMAKDLKAHGFDVLDYETASKQFNEGGLPVEDTKSSRDKYAELAQKLGVDAIIVPYYGTFASASFNILWSSFQYTSVATLQIFDAKNNEFISRIDDSGKNGYNSSILLDYLIVPIFVDLWNGFTPPDTRWGRAFNAGIRKGLEPFYARYEG